MADLKREFIPATLEEVIERMLRYDTEKRAERGDTLTPKEVRALNIMKEVVSDARQGVNTIPKLQQAARQSGTRHTTVGRDLNILATWLWERFS